jgi:hypothetical protein
VRAEAAAVTKGVQSLASIREPVVPLLPPAATVVDPSMARWMEAMAIQIAAISEALKVLPELKEAVQATNAKVDGLVARLDAREQVSQWSSLQKEIAEGKLIDQKMH